VPIRLPALRERASDIPSSLSTSLTKFNDRLKQHVTAPEPRLADVLCAYSWPGNIRELENVIERRRALCEASKVRVARPPPRSAVAPPRPQAHVTDADPKAALSNEGGSGARQSRDGRLERELVSRGSPADEPATSPTPARC